MSAEQSTAVAKIEAFRSQLEAREHQYAAALPKTIPTAKFQRVAMTAVTINPKLLYTERNSLMLSLMKCAQDGLIPDGREAALVIFRDKNKGEVAQYLPMVAGIRKLVMQSGKVRSFDQRVVHEKDEFDYMLGSSPSIHHRPQLSDPGPIIAAYSVAVMDGGYTSIEVMGVEEIDKVRQVSRSKDRGPWIDWFDEMAKKTVAKRHAKMLPLSSELIIQDADEEAPDQPTLPEPRMRLAAQFDRLVEGDIESPTAEEALEDYNQETGEVIENDESKP